MNKAIKKVVALTAAGLVSATLVVYPSVRLDNKIEALEHRVERAAKKAKATKTITDESLVYEAESAATVEHLGEFKLTAYCTCPVCCGQWADGITASGSKAVPGQTIAVDPDVIPMGSTVYINGNEYIAEDIGGAIKGNRIDILFPSHQEALEFGIQYADVSYIRN